jgi:hypothetical protein
MIARPARSNRTPKSRSLFLFLLFALTNTTIAISQIKTLFTSILGSSNNNNNNRKMSTKEFIQDEIANHDVCILTPWLISPPTVTNACLFFYNRSHSTPPPPLPAPLYVLRSSFSPNPTVRIVRPLSNSSRALAAPMLPSTSWIK